MVNRRSLTGASLALALALVCCGDDGQPVPGYVDPCQAPVAALLNCPASALARAPGPFDEQASCEKLVRCGVLADEWYTSDGASHRLDYAWCLRRLQLAGRPTDPCAQQPYTREHSDSAMRCIEALPCSAIGLPLAQKLGNMAQTPDLDRYQCPNGDQRRTATVCDQGLLSY